METAKGGMRCGNTLETNKNIYQTKPKKNENIISF